MRIKIFLASALMSMVFVDATLEATSTPPRQKSPGRRTAPSFAAVPPTATSVPLRQSSSADLESSASGSADFGGNLGAARARAPAAASAVDIRTAMALRLRAFFPDETLEEDDQRIEAVMELGAYLSGPRSTNKLFEKMDKKLSEMEEAGDNSSSQYQTLLANYRWIQGLRAANAKQPVPFEDQWATAVSGSDLRIYVQLLDQLSPERVDLSQVRFGGGRSNVARSSTPTRQRSGSFSSTGSGDFSRPAFTRLDQTNPVHVEAMKAHVKSERKYGGDVYNPRVAPTADAPQVVISDKGGDKPHVSVNTGQSAAGSAFTEETF